MNTKIGQLAYADDIGLLTENREQFKKHSKKLTETVKRIGMEINMKKRNTYDSPKIS